MCWRKDLDSVQKRMLAVMNSNIPDIPHDVTFVAGEEKETATTGIEIVSVSSTSECNPIVISDVHPNGLKNIMKYAYSGVMSVDMKDVLSTLYASHKYDIPELTQYCSELLHSNLSVDNVVTIYQASTIFNEMKLKEKAWEFIESNGGALLDSEQFIEFSEENLVKFLSLDKIPDSKSEADVFKAVLRWGNFHCDQNGLNRTKANMRTVLKNSISLIRFPAMEVDEFNEIVEPSGILSSKECIHLLKYFASSGEKRVLLGATLLHSNKCRTGIGNFLICTADITDKLEISPASTSYDKFTISGNTDVIKLISVGIVLPLRCTLRTGKSVSVGLFDYSLNQWTHSATKMVLKPLEICYIEFEKPVCLKSNVEYLLRVNYPNGTYVANPVEVIKYPITSRKQSFTWTTANTHQLKINLVSGSCCFVIWALQIKI